MTDGPEGLPIGDQGLRAAARVLTPVGN
jgi:hypothetical protein